LFFYYNSQTFPILAITLNEHGEFFIIFIIENMNPKNRFEQMKKIQSEALELFTKKNNDYGDAFAKYGVIGVLMRMEDKLHRYMSITKKGVNLVNDEGIRDTLIDLHNYSAMALMLIDDTNETFSL